MPRLLLAAALMLLCVPVRGQQTPDPAFEVATIKPAAPSRDGRTHIVYPPDGSFSASNITLAALMEWAYAMPSRQILNQPSWLAATRFDLQGKSDEASAEIIRKGSGEDGRAIKRRMVQQLLAERFGLSVHRETRVLPAYHLVLAKGGSRLAVTKSSGRKIDTGRSSFRAEGLTSGLIAEQLSQIAGRVVVDRTGLTDRYDLKLEWTPDNAPVTDGSPPALFTAIEEQLGLRLEPAREPVPVLVIDRIGDLSPN